MTVGDIGSIFISVTNELCVGLAMYFFLIAVFSVTRLAVGELCFVYNGRKMR